MFRGNFTAKVDEKGRISFPAKFREGLEKTGSSDLCITNFKVDGYHCLDVYPQSAWLELEERLRNMTERSPRVIRFFQNYYFPGVQECQIDRQGRILVCSRLRDYAGLGHEVVFTGISDKLRIYSQENWDAVFAEGEASLPDDPDVVSVLGF
jgi:MraZ protein